MNIKPVVRLLRLSRSLHKYAGAGIALFVIVTAVSGVLLGWKKDVALLQPPAREGTSRNIGDWQSLAVISEAATGAMHAAGHRGQVIDRMDVRPDQGIVKVQFTPGYWEVQVDAASGEVLSLGRRHADWIERIHDGSIVGDIFKVTYTNALGLGLLTLAISGLWLWIGPGIVRRQKTLRKSK